MDASIGWKAATERALYGAASDGACGFFTRSAPAAHFRTSVHASPLFAAALLTMTHRLDAVLGHPPELDVVDVGAGRGELLTDLLAAAPPDLGSRLRCTAVERAARPDALAPEITWLDETPRTITGLVIANEWLDNVPVDVVEQSADGPRVVLVDPATGAERPGPPPDPPDGEWLRQWWPLSEPGRRAEIGRPRDEAWAGVVARLSRGIAVAVDYAHTRQARPPFGTLVGYRNGRAVPPVPDGSCDITGHVALDACATAAGASESSLTTQRAVLRGLGLRGARPPVELARTDPRRYLRDLGRASEEAELVDPAGLGAFGWLVQSVDLSVNAVIRVTMPE